MRTLLAAFGNPARQDDGLGPALVEALEVLALPGLELDADYQPAVELAAELPRFERVVFADARLDGPEPYSFEPLEPEPVLRFSTHALTPGGVLALARAHFGFEGEAWLLGIRGYAFAPFTEGLTPGARRNLDAALAFLRDWLAGGG